MTEDLMDWFVKCNPQFHWVAEFPEGVDIGAWLDVNFEDRRWRLVYLGYTQEEIDEVLNDKDGE